MTFFRQSSDLVVPIGQGGIVNVLQFGFDEKAYLRLSLLGL